MGQSLPERIVSPMTLRRAFNESQLTAMLGDGTLTPDIRDDRELQQPESIGAPPGTRSQYIRYYDAGGRWLVDVHQYRLPDGSLGASGKPDPKRMLVGEETWVADPAMEES